jgi:hypothetical protein
MKKNSGFLIIEVLIAIVILSMVLLTIFSMVRVSQIRAQKTDFNSEMAILSQNGVEIASDNLKNNWAISLGVYHPVFYNDENTWGLDIGEEANLETRFTRKIEIKQVCRNHSTGERIDATPCSGDVDQNSRLVVVTVSWMNIDFGGPVSSELLVIKTE